MANEPVDQQTARDPATPTGRLTGQVTYLFAYDIAYEMARRPITTLLGRDVTQYQATVRRAPREQFFYSPQMVSLPEVQRAGPGGPVQVRRTVKLFPVGAVSIAIHVPFAVDRIEDLLNYHDLRIEGQPLEREARELADQVVRQLSGTLIRPVAVRDEEAYTVFCLDAGPVAAGAVEAFSAQDWLAANAAAVAGLLNEDDGRLLSKSEVDDTVNHHFTYHHDDLAVMDWDAALVIQPADGLDEVLYVMELANVQLAELVAYDRFLDDLLDRSYRDLARPRTGTGVMLRSLRETRLDLSRLSDELSNTTKFFGDWYLARIYQRLFGLFHLNDWQRVIDEKLNTLGDLYQLMRQDRNNRWMMALEVSIVLLFVIDLVILLVGLGK